MSNEQTPLDTAKSHTGYIIQTIENHMLYPLEQGNPGNQKNNLERIKNDLIKLKEMLDKIK